MPMKQKNWRGMEGENRVYHEVGQIANQPAKLTGFGGECVRERAAKPKEGLGKKSALRSPTKVAATQAKVDMTSFLFFVVCKVVCFCSQVFVP